MNKQLRTADKGRSSCWGLGKEANNSSLKKTIILRNVTRGLGLDGFLGTNWAMEYGHEVWNMECQESLKNRIKRSSKVKVRANSSAMENNGSEPERRLYILYRNGNANDQFVSRIF